MIWCEPNEQLCWCSVTVTNLTPPRPACSKLLTPKQKRLQVQPAAPREVGGAKWSLWSSYTAF